MNHGETVREFEEALAKRLGAKWAIAMTNGTVTLEVALRALGVQPEDRVATTSLTMAATTIAILNVGAVPVYCDVDPDTWLMVGAPLNVNVALPVALYGLQNPTWDTDGLETGRAILIDAAQTLQRGNHGSFTSISFQRSKILNTGEGGALLTNSDELATKARSISSLGYKMEPGQSRIDSSAIRSPSYERHHTYPCLNARMNDVTAAAGLEQLAIADDLLNDRKRCADLYAKAIEGVGWLTPQHVPEGFTHDYWAYVVAIDIEKKCAREQWALCWDKLAGMIVKHGGERPYGAWRLTYQEPAFTHLAKGVAYQPTDFSEAMEGVLVPVGLCPVAESLQPRLMQMATNDYESAYWNALALVKAIKDIEG